MSISITKFLSENKEELINNYLEINSIAKAVRKLCVEKDIPYTESFRAVASKIINSEDLTSVENITSTETVQYKTDTPVSILSALKHDGTIMDIEEYCASYNIPFEQVKTYKLVTHTGKGAYYNIASADVRNVEIDEDWINQIKDILSGDISNFLPQTSIKKFAVGSKTGVVKIADLHVGALIDNLIRTKDYNVNILVDKLEMSAMEINRRGYELVHIHILGDILESFTGLSHINSWKSLDKNLVGAKAIKLSVEILHKHFFQKINNLGDIKIVAGNHDRVSSNNKEDVEGDAANLVAWGLELLGYNVEFHPIVITHVVEGIAHILTHGHHGISKKSTKQLCWDYGVQGKYNLICEGHLHSIIQKLSTAQRENFTTVQDDAVDHRRMNCPSFFTGNYYSETLGYTSESGFVITEDNGQGVPNVFYYAV